MSRIDSRAEQLRATDKTDNLFLGQLAARGNLSPVMRGVFHA